MHVHTSSWLAPRYCVGMLVALPATYATVTKTPRHSVLPASLPVTYRWINHDPLLRKKGSLIGRVDLAPGVRATIVASHLPFHPAAADLGNSARLDAMTQVASELSRGCRQDAVLIWAGDLNFRVVNGADQLSQLLAGGTVQVSGFTPWFESALRHGPTCKVARHRSSSCAAVYRGEQPASAAMDCYDAARTPSFCDRVLCATRVNGGIHVRPSAAQRALLAAGTEASDHTPVLATFSLGLRHHRL
jgi:endonuclease/exonuclease/phosphatase family metal-dependent hydrolase